MSKKVAVIMGSISDLSIAEKAFEQLESLDIEYEAHIMSAHRTPEKAIDFALNAKDNGFGVIIALAGMAAHLAGVLAANTTLPVIGVPCKGGALDGVDALLATVQMPTGIPVATVALNGAANAAILAAQMLAISNEDLASVLDIRKEEMAVEVAAKDADLQAEVAKRGKHGLKFKK